MREYEGKCSEELRVEDYSLGRKGPQAGAAPLAAAAPASVRFTSSNFSPWSSVYMNIS